MSVSENFVGIVLIAAIVMVGWLIIQSNNVNQSITLIEANELFFQQEKLNNDISVILETTDPLTKLSMKRIIGDVVYSREAKTTIAGQEIKFLEYVEDFFNAVYGPKNYYLRIQPPLRRVRLYFVIDGSETMAEDLDFILEIIPELDLLLKDIFSKQQEIDFIVESKIFILKNLEESLTCTKVLDSGVDCSEIPMEYSINGITFNELDVNGLYNKYFKETIKNPESEYFWGFSKNRRFYNSPGWDRDTNIPRGFSYEDWATGVAFVAREIEEKSVDDEEEPTMTFIFPFSDELSTGSEADECFNYYANNYNGNKFLSCTICHIDNDRFERSEKSVEHAINVLKDYDYKVFPVARKPDFSYEDWQLEIITNLYKSSRNINNNFYNDCKGHESGFVHGDQYVIEKMLEHMDLIASATGGKILDFTGIDDVEEQDLFEAFEEAISVVSTLEFGFKKDFKERFAIRRIFPLGNNNLADLTFWLYKEKEFHDIQSFQAIKLPPVPIIYNDKTWGETPLIVKIDGRGSYSPSGEYPLSLEWKIFDGNTNNLIFELDNNTNFEYTFSANPNELQFYDINLLVIDSIGQTNSTVKRITVSSFKPKMKLFFVSLEHEHDNFVSRANIQAEEFLKNIDCRDEIELIIIEPTQLVCPEGSLIQRGAATRNCIKNFDNTYDETIDRIVGLRRGNFIGGAAAGYTWMGNDVVYSTSNPTRREVTAHELGHTYNACEEYNTGWWLHQNEQLSSVGGCINDFPGECGFDSTIINAPNNLSLGENPTDINFGGLSGFCIGNTLGQFGIRIQHRLNCNTIATNNSIIKPDSCGDGVCQSGENIFNCPTDCRNQMSYDCPGAPIFDGFNNFIGLSAMGGPLPGGQSREHFYPNKMRAAINESICGG